MLAVDLLKKRCIRAEDTNEVLFRVLNEPLSQHLPSNSRVSNGLEKLVDIQNYVSATNDDMNFIFVVSVTDHKKINICTDDVISENDGLWYWFLRNLKAAFGEPNNLIIVFDGHKSI
ncbi:unnamed protein product, partial [Citrullus colocynthis]